MQRPPSTSIATPVIIDASSLHKKHAALPRSSGVEKRPSGIVARNFARISGVSSPMKVLSIGVSPATGLSAMTRMPNGASSTAIARVAVMTKPLLALYQHRRECGVAHRRRDALGRAELAVGDQHACAFGDELANDAFAEARAAARHDRDLALQSHGTSGQPCLIATVFSVEKPYSASKPFSRP